MLLSGTANQDLATAVAAAMGVPLWRCECERFPDGELRVIVPSRLRGHDVYVIQSTGPPVHESLMGLLLLLDACRRAGAARVTAIVPYVGYARQDRRTVPGEAVGLRVVAEAVSSSGVDRIVVVDPHTPGLEAIFGTPVDALTSVPVLTAALAGDVPDDAVVVAPDQGAVKLAGRYGAALDRPVALVAKQRVSGEDVRITGLVGDVKDRGVVIVDDMISTAGTVEAAAHALLAAGARDDLTIVATHGLLVGPARERLARLRPRRVIVTDSLAQSGDGLVTVRSIAPLLSAAIGRLCSGEPLDELATYG